MKEEGKLKNDPQSRAKKVRSKSDGGRALLPRGLLLETLVSAVKVKLLVSIWSSFTSYEVSKLIGNSGRRK